MLTVAVVTYGGGRRSAPYDPSRFADLRREDWDFPAGILWSDERVTCGILDLDRNGLTSHIPYVFGNPRAESAFLNAHLWSLPSLWAGLEVALNRASNFTGEADGFAVSLREDGSVQIILAFPFRCSDAVIDGEVILSRQDAISLLRAVEAALRHGSDYYWRLVDRDAFSAKYRKRILSAANPDFLPCSLRAAPI